LAFGYLFAICVLTGIVFGLAPALQLSKTDINEGLRETGRGTSGGFRSRRLTGALVVAEISLALVLMVGASLLVRSLFNLEALDVGVRSQHVITMAVDLPTAKYPRIAERLAFTDR